MQLPWQQLSWYFIFLRAGLKAIMLTMDSPRLAAAKLTSRTGPSTTLDDEEIF